MSFNLFAPLSTDSIRVGYIDPSLGYVDGFTICQANEYAQKNPGTVFIFRDGRNNIRYLNINEVNKLTPQDAVYQKDDCGGINNKKVCGPPVVTFYGGGGIGAQGNPIIGNDGSILAVDVVRRGHGYAFPPAVTATDDCNIGTGAVLRAIIGDTADQEETFTREEDFEDYEICTFEDIGYGVNWGPNGEDLGQWSPSTFLPGNGVDPIEREIRKYQTAIRDKEKFFNTRVKRPSRVRCVSNPRINVNTYPVSYITNPEDSDPRKRSPWSDFMNTFAISPVPPSNVRGSDFATEMFSFEWNLDFPYDGEYEFRGCKDNDATLYFDDEVVSKLDGFNKNPKLFKKYITKGLHNIRIELVNAPIYEDKIEVIPPPSPVEQPAGGNFIKKGGQYYLIVGGNDLVGLKFNLNYNDNPSVAGTAITKITIPSHDGKVVLERERSGSTFKERGSVSAVGTFKANQTYGPIIFEGRANGSPDPQIANTGDPQKNPGTFQQKINFFDGDGRDTNASITLIPPPEQKSPGRIEGLSPEQAQAIASQPSTVEVNFGLNVDGQYNNSIEIPDLGIRISKNFDGPGKNLNVTRTIEYGKVYRVNFATNVRGKVKLRNQGNNVIEVEDATDFNWKDMQIVASKGRFFNLSGDFCDFIVDKPPIPPITRVVSVISPKSWNENPMGVALSIIPPDPPIPQEPKPQQEGRCPPNPVWSTRYPGAEKQWYPCKFRSPGVITETITKEVSQENAYQTQSTQEVEFSLYRQGGGKNTGGITFTFTPVGGRGNPITFVHTGKGKTSITQKVKIEKNVTYKVTASLNSNAPARAITLEQGLLAAKNKEVKSGETGNKVFADAIPSANDNDDLIITIPAGGGKFSSGKRSKVSGGGQTRNTYELTYILEGNSKSSKPSDKRTVTETRKVNVNGWSRFMNRYAISPVKPLDDPGTDGAGITYTNSWTVDIPFEGFYSLRGLGDNKGRILIDGNEVYTLGGFQNESPEDKRLYLTKGNKRITVEIYNAPIIETKVVKKKIFNSKDWQVPAITTSQQEQPAGGNFVKEGGQYYLKVGGNDLVGLKFNLNYNDNPFTAGTAVTKITIPSYDGKVVLQREKSGSTFKEKGSILATGTFKANQTYGPIVFEGRVSGSADPQIVNTGDPKKDPGTFQQRINFFDSDGRDTNASITLVPPPDQKSGARTTETIPPQPAIKNGVTYSGPVLFHYTDNRWGSFMNEYSVSPYLPPINLDNPEINGVKEYVWKGVNFSETGQYEITFQSDNNGVLIIDGREVLASDGYAGPGQKFNVNISKGIYDVVVRVNNVPDSTNIFLNNPTGLALLIEKDVLVTTNLSAKEDGPAWTTNPVGVSAALVSPPCPKKISGRGVIQEVLVDDPGNGYIAPTSGGGQYPVTLRLKSVVVENPGINYNCGVDEIVITPDNGAKLEYSCDTFGRITDVKVVEPGGGFTTYPTISMVTPADAPNGGQPTGVNASFRPQFEIVRDPVEAINGSLPPERLIQVTDLVGLKQTGYVDGRAYYGAVYYENGERFAGYYKTVGTPIKVYDTLKESIDAQVTTRPDAIQRQGTDIRSNDPRLNIPNTPQDLT